MANRLQDSLSPYLRQHADNPVDWFEWGEEAFAEAARREVPVFLSVGYAACHWCHVMAHESFEDPATAADAQPALRRDQGRPRGAPGRGRGLHAGHPGPDRARRLADERVPDPGPAAVLRRHLLPAGRRGTGCRRSGRCWARSPRPGPSAATRCTAAPRPSSASWPSGSIGAVPGTMTEADCDRGRGAAAGRVRRGGRRLRRRAQVPAVDGAGGAAPRRRRAGDDAWSSATCDGDGPRRHLRPAGRRVRALQRRRRLGGAALREDALRQRAAARRLHALVAADRRIRWPSGWWPRRSTGCSPRCGRPRAPSPPAWTPTPSTSTVTCTRARTTSGPLTSSPRCSATRTAPGRRRCSG